MGIGLRDESFFADLSGCLVVERGVWGVFFLTMSRCAVVEAAACNGVSQGLKGYRLPITAGCHRIMRVCMESCSVSSRDVVESRSSILVVGV